MLWEAGQDMNISPGGPNMILRLEGGIISYLSDIDRTNNPYEVGFEALVDLDQEDDFIGKDALREIYSKGPQKKLIGAEILGDPITETNAEHWPVFVDGKQIGSMNALVFSPRLNKNICYVILDIKHAISGNEVMISSPDQDRQAILVDLPWLERVKK
jgi:aminomethyltransferase